MAKQVAGRQAGRQAGQTGARAGEKAGGWLSGQVGLLRPAILVVYILLMYALHVSTSDVLVVQIDSVSFVQPHTAFKQHFNIACKDIDKMYFV